MVSVIEGFHCICYSLSLENNLPTFWLSVPVVIRVKAKKCEQMLLFIAMHYWGYTSPEVKGQWGLLFPPCLLITAVQLWWGDNKNNKQTYKNESLYRLGSQWFCILHSMRRNTPLDISTFSISVLASPMCEMMRLDLSMLPWETREKTMVNR